MKQEFSNTRFKLYASTIYLDLLVQFGVSSIHHAPLFLVIDYSCLSFFLLGVFPYPLTPANKHISMAQDIPSVFRPHAFIPPGLDANEDPSDSDL